MKRCSLPVSANLAEVTSTTVAAKSRAHPETKPLRSIVKPTDKLTKK
jgi:hypothetical protein